MSNHYTITHIRTIIFLLPGITLGLLHGCSFDAVNNINPDMPVTLSQGTGMIVGSVTSPRVQHYWEVSRFRYRKLGESKSGVLESASPTANFLWFKDNPIEPGGVGPDSGLESQLGRLFAVELEVGTYEIYQLDTTGNILIHMQPVRFDVRPGEIIYLGNLHVRFCLYTPNRRAYRSYVNGGIPSVQNEAQRDLALLVLKFPFLKGMQIVPAIINDNAWQELEKTGLPSLETSCKPE